MVKIDLHTHSTYSDGKYSPKELIDLAIKRKVEAIALTDHDTAKGNIEAIKYSKGKNIEFVPGIEITIAPPDNCKELHMVGLFIDPENKEIKNITVRHNIYRRENLKKIIRKLNNLGYKINFKELLNEGNSKHLGRPLIAQILMRKYPNEFKERGDVFKKLIGKNGLAFVKPKGTSLKQAIKIIHNAKGIAIIAHPCFLGDNMQEVIKDFIKLGGDGIERDYIKKDSIPKDTLAKLKRLIKKYNLIVSGGSDFHEIEAIRDLGVIGITKDEFDFMKKRI